MNFNRTSNHSIRQFIEFQLFTSFVLFVVEFQFKYTSQIPDRTLKLTRVREGGHPGFSSFWIPARSTRE